ncbi:MAG: 30S ribosomal protein S15 [Chloroflexi bacterium]|jgi:small subunit ribosomal protein S15|nr:30S ribosomal protein S15 [Chloroflexota bacterium]
MLGNVSLKDGFLDKEKKQGIVSQFRLHENDTGSTRVQVAVLSEGINQISEHLKINSHDYHSQRALLKLIGRRKRLLAYLNRTEPQEYYSLIAKLGLRK